MNDTTAWELRCKLKFLAFALGNMHEARSMMSAEECIGIQTLLDDIANMICQPDEKEGAA